jgi:hypothetical protein
MCVEIQSLGFHLVTLIHRVYDCVSQIFAVKSKFKVPFGLPFVRNYYNFAGIFGGACLAMFIVYTPPLHSVFGTWAFGMFQRRIVDRVELMLPRWYL